jgi:hypothetical protein
MDAGPAPETLGECTRTRSERHAVERRSAIATLGVNPGAAAQALGENTGARTPTKRGHSSKRAAAFTVQTFSLLAEREQTGSTPVVDRCNRSRLGRSGLRVHSFATVAFETLRHVDSPSSTANPD